MSRRRHVRPSSSAVPRHRRSFDPMRLIKPGTIGALVIAVAALLGLGGTAALWQDSATITTGSLNSGSIGIQQAGLSNAAVAYSAGTLSKTTSLTLSNPGTSAADLSAAATITVGSTELAKTVTVRLWAAGADGACTETTTASGETGSWAALKGLPTSLPAASTVTYCLRTAIPDATKYAGSSYTATLSIVASRGGWQSSADATVTQSVAAAGVSANCSGDQYNVYLRWANSSLPEPQRTQLQYNIIATAYGSSTSKTFTPNSQPHGGWTEAQFLQWNTRSQLGSGTFKIEIYERASNGKNGTKVLTDWIEVSPAGESAYVLCAKDPSKFPQTAPVVQAMSCTTLAGGARFKVAWDRPEGSHDQWLWDLRVDNKVVSSGYNQSWRAPELDKSVLGSLTVGRSYALQAVRSATATAYYETTVYIKANGQVQCEPVTAASCLEQSGNPYLYWPLTSGNANANYEVRFGDTIVVPSARGTLWGQQYLAFDTTSTNISALAKNTRYAVDVIRDGTVVYSDSIALSGSKKPAC